MNYNCWLKCTNENCETSYSVFETIYRCRQCGELLEVEHDLKELQSKSASEWRHLFDDRYKRNNWPHGSGVWGKKEWIFPNVENENIISFYEGGTNLFWAERLEKELGLSELWIKQCGNSHTGSFKDLGMTVLVSATKQMINDGKEIKALACASTGDTSAALAAYAAAANIPSLIFLPKDKVSVAQLIQPITNCALVLSIDTDFDGCMEIVQKVCEKYPIYLANSINSIRLEGQKTVSIELTQQFNWEVPDIIIIPGGNLGNISALGKGFLQMQQLGLIDKLPRLVCAQAKNANPLYRSYINNFNSFESMKAETTLATAIQIGNPVSFKRAIKTLKHFNGIVEEASEEELANAMARADKTGMYNCPQTGVALAVLEKLIKKGEIDRKEKVVVISTAHGLKFTEVKIRYHQDQINDISNIHANKPVDLPNDLDKVLFTLDKFFKENK
ncbi:MAG: threonine synthase [Nitrospinae bacterium]|nr:threonine synthase [Nitrospinota bacterium]